ncbi:MAG TPA: PilZ domain-containing protein [Polyangiaceae bacterium]
MPTAESVVRPHALLPSTDRREHFRAPLAGPVLVDALSQWHRARCENVSVGGVAVAGAGSLPVGKTVEVYFELPSGVAVETRAQVVRSRGEEVALCFLALDRGTELALRAHCRAAEAR